MSDTSSLLPAASDAFASSGEDSRSGNGSAGKSRPANTGLTGMLLAQLQKLATELGISGTGRMRKSELIEAIGRRQSGNAAPTTGVNGATNGTPASETSRHISSQSSMSSQTRAPRRAAAVSASAEQAELPVGEANPMSENAATSNVPVVRDTSSEAPSADASSAARTRRRAVRQAGNPAVEAFEPAMSSPDSESAPVHGDSRESDTTDRGGNSGRRSGSGRDSGRNGNGRDGGRSGGSRDGGRDSNRSSQRRAGERSGDRSSERSNDRSGDRSGDRSNDRSNDRSGDRFDDRGDDDSEYGRRRRGGRYRDRNRRGGRERDRNDIEPVVTDDDVLLPVAGIVDILDNYAFIRTSGYLSGSNDVYVAMSQVRKYGLRRGVAVTRSVRQPRDGERQNKYNPLVRLDTVNGIEAEQAQRREEFHKLTPLYPQDRLRLETEPHQMTTRVIDLVMPIGKGQRALIVSPPKAGKTMVLQSIANAITTNNPECHLMVVLVDERPEEVTDMQRSVKGEVIASTFDRPPTDHTTVAELAIERAKRLVELGHDVVVLLDSITRLGRAYNLAAPASGRILSGGVDSTALYPPKRFLGAARNIEHGGSLTILATALVETGSTMDTVIFEEFKGTGNAELKLDRRIADKRVFPAVDVDASGTRKEELLLAADELAIIYKLRKVLHALESQQALDLVLDKLKKTRTNAEFLMQIQKTTPGNGD